MSLKSRDIKVAAIAVRLKGGSMNAHETVQLLSEQMPEIRQRFGVRELAIFGSVARNEARPDSDVDVLVEFTGRPTFDNYMGLKLHLEKLFTAGVDLAINSDLRPGLRPRIEKEAVHVP
jgi:predicted nucleotidyltransferase